ncbi:hypothetical protein CEXT_231491 [Caerostris extrusa]|uniref:Uncharacterized protein n=1 Tax=Caerostris extrusa TaxID=172846 RepID=A0AAV4T0S8_CAEEX|nr:hypothetical protein CEXT_231491 [Caerostris extrusa]
MQRHFRIGKKSSKLDVARHFCLWPNLYQIFVLFTIPLNGIYPKNSFRFLFSANYFSKNNLSQCAATIHANNMRNPAEAAHEVFLKSFKIIFNMDFKSAQNLLFPSRSNSKSS